MKINRATGLLLVIPMAAMLASCSDDNKEEPENPDQTGLEMVSPAKAVNVLTTPTGSQVIGDADYVVVYHAANRTADLYINNVSVTPGATGEDYVISALPCSYSNAAGVSHYEIDVDQAVADGMPYTFRDINVKISTPNTIDEQEYTNMSVDFELGNGQKVTMVPTEFTAVGTTTTTNNGNGSKHTSKRMIYRFVVDAASRTADLYVSNADFAAGMPALGEMRFAGIGVTYTSDGFTFSSPSLIPSIDSVPSPNRAVTNLRGEVDFDDSDVDVDFTCMGVFSVSADLTGAYTPATK